MSQEETFKVSHYHIVISVLLAFAFQQIQPTEAKQLHDKILHALDELGFEQLNAYSLLVSSRPGGGVASPVTTTYLKFNINLHEIENHVRNQTAKIKGYLKTPGKMASAASHYLHELDILNERANRSLSRIRGLENDHIIDTRNERFVGYVALATAIHAEYKLYLQGKEINRIRHLVEDFTTHQDELNQKMVELADSQIASYCLTLAQAFIAHLKETIDRLEFTVEDLQARRAPVHFMDEKDLDQALDTVFKKGNVLDKNLVHALPTVSHITGHMVDITLQVPSALEIFQLQRISDVKIIDKTQKEIKVIEFIAPPFVAVNQDGWFLELQGEDLQMCQHVQDFHLYLCDELVQYSSVAPTCAASVLRRDASGVLKHCQRKTSSPLMTRIAHHQIKLNSAHHVREICDGKVKIIQPVTTVYTKPHCQYRINQLLKINPRPHDQIVQEKAHFIKKTDIINGQVMQDLKTGLYHEQNLLAQAKKEAQETHDDLQEDLADLKRGDAENFWFTLAIGLGVTVIIIVGLGLVYAFRRQIMERIGLQATDILVDNAVNKRSPKGSYKRDPIDTLKYMATLISSRLPSEQKDSETEQDPETGIGFNQTHSVHYKSGSENLQFKNIDGIEISQSDDDEK